MPVRGRCGGSAEISTGWTRNLYLLPDRLSEARSAESREAHISGINADATRTYCLSLVLAHPGDIGIQSTRLLLKEKLPCAALARLTQSGFSQESSWAGCQNCVLCSTMLSSFDFSRGRDLCREQTASLQIAP